MKTIMVDDELWMLEQFTEECAGIPEIEKHAKWAEAFAPELKGANRARIRETLEREVGKVFVGVLEDAGVFKRDENGKAAFLRFIKTL